MAHALRHLPRVLLAGTVAVVLLAACQPAAPAAEVRKPKRRSFEESSAWRPSAPPAAPANNTGATLNDNLNNQARQVQQTWDQARQATTDAERQRLANEALRQTRAMAEPQPSAHQ